MDMAKRMLGSEAYGNFEELALRLLEGDAEQV
jgi:hypothetical protein